MTRSKDAAPFRPVQAKPCGECPFRRKSLAGWLGRASPEEFVQLIGFGYPMPCHSTIDYDDTKWQKQWEAGEIGMLCRGALVYARNTCKQFNNPALPMLPADRDNFFSNPIEFIQHHRSGLAKSWEDDDVPKRKKAKR